jgi:baseplate structural protein gp10
MATVTGLTADRMLAIEAASVVSGYIDPSGHLILVQFDDTEIDAGYMLASVPDASETVKGVVELATTAEASTGTDTTRAVTPAGLSAAVGAFVPDATETVKGKVELATTTEASTGTDTVRAVTPAGLAAAVPTHVPAASTTVQGKVELATTSEATTGTDTVRAVTPAGLKAAIDAVLQLIFPVGSFYISHSVSTNPNTLLGFGTWTAVQDRFLIGTGARAAGATGGAETQSLATANVPSHTHSFSATTGQDTHTHTIGRDHDGATGSSEYVIHSTGLSGAEQAYNGAISNDTHDHTVSGTTGTGSGTGTAFSILNPYLAVYIWRRTA